MSMNYCKITLYYDCDIKSDKNFKVDDIDDYLTELDNVVLADKYNYIKPALKMNVILKLGSYSELNFGFGSGDSEYIKIEYYDSEALGATPYQVLYCFVSGKKWKSDSAVEYELYLDTINTYKDSVIIHAKSTIHRQHKDRFKKIGTEWYRDIDLRPEGVNPMLYKKNDTVIEGDGRKYYLVYKNIDDINPTDYNQVNPINVCIYTDKPYFVKANYLNFTVGSVGNDVYKFYPNMSEVFIKVNDTIFQVHERTGYFRTVGIIQKDPSDSTKVWVGVNYYCWVNNSWQPASQLTVSASATTVSIYSSLSTSISCEYAYNGGTPVAHTLTLYDGWQPLGLIDELDRTDSKIVKIIELPYCPFRYIEVASAEPKGDIRLLDGILIDTVYFVMYYIGYKTQLTSGVKFANNALRYKIEAGDATIQQQRDDVNESKLYHSEFYKYKIVYDSFSKDYPMEYIDIADYVDNWWSNNFKLSYIVSQNVASKFVFKDTIKRLTDEDYSNVLVISRNNELPIYSSQYLNYLRNGYNFDVKNKQQQEILSGFKTGAGIISGVGMIAGGIASANPLGGIAVVSGIASIASSVVNAVNTEISLENSITQKLVASKAQAMSVSQCDDVELMDVYANNNKLKITDYSISDTMKKAVADLFYYCGYKCEYQGIPDETSRLYFNFVSADIDCVGTNMPDEILEDYKNRYKIGLTVLHKVEVDDDVYEWDFTQQFENWEVSLL